MVGGKGIKKKNTQWLFQSSGKHI